MQEAISPALPIPPLQWHNVTRFSPKQISKYLSISSQDYFGAAHSKIYS